MGRKQHSILSLRRTRRKGNNNNNRVKVAPIVSLPNELVSEVIAMVAASSFNDFFNAKLSCKAFCEVAEDRFVLQRTSLDKFPVIPWCASEGVSFFINECKESGNPEALYRQGVIDFFSDARLESSLDCLRKAASAGHNGALYALSISLIFLGGEFKKVVIEFLSHLKRSRKTRRIVEGYRKNLTTIINRMWIRNTLTLNTKPICCTMQDQHVKNVGWSFDQYEDNQECEACGCDQEISFIIRALPKFSY